MSNDRSNDFVRTIRAFLEAAGDNVSDQPDVRAVARYTGMQFERLAEKMQAINHPIAGTLQRIGHEFKRGAHDHTIAFALFDPDRCEKLLDADIDLAWVSLAGSVTAGADVPGGCADVGRSNISRVGPGGKVERDANGKIMEPPYYIPAQLAPFTHLGRKRESA
jgi:predicted HAD superfamily Cof-like phosphohydrolase